MLTSYVGPAKSGACTPALERRGIKEFKREPTMTCRIDRLVIGEDLVILRISGQIPDGTISQCYEFAHELYREVFYRRQAPERLARLRLRIGDTTAGAISLPS